MAVKYSKTRDFGAKGRKTRKLGNKMFTLHSTYKYKIKNNWWYGWCEPSSIIKSKSSPQLFFT